jgi:hypothetical protein
MYFDKRSYSEVLEMPIKFRKDYIKYIVEQKEREKSEMSKGS